jgi:hypothetical protein
MRAINILLLSLTITAIGLLTSCTRTQKCECSTSSIAYDPNGSAYDNIEISSFTVKGSKSENKTQCDIIKSNQIQGNGYTTECEVKNK